MTISILDQSLKLEIFFETPDCEFEDNICVSFVETCPEDEKVFIHDETNIFLTPEEAETIARDLLQAAEMSRKARQEKCS